MANKIDVSIIILTKNGMPLLERVLSAVFNQKTQYKYEIIVIDSGSTDQTLDVVKKHSARLHQITSQEFSHSQTRNLGASLSKADKYLIFLNQDAVPTDEDWLNNMVKSIEYEPDLKAVCATELIEESNHYFNVTGVAHHVFRNSATKGIYVIDPYILEKFSDLRKEKQVMLFPFTTVCAIFDKKHFKKFPFNENVSWGEDLHWAVDNSNNGFKSACSSFARVYHHHTYGRKEWKEIDTHLAKLYKDIFDMNMMSIYNRSKRRLDRLVLFLQKKD